MADETNTKVKPEGVVSTLEKKNLEYPLNNPDDYLGRIVFNVLKEAETDLGNLLSAAEKVVKQAAIDTEEEESGLEKVAGKNSEDQQNAKNTHRNGPVKNQTQKNPRLLTSVNPKRQVSLYLPVGLQFRDTVAYDNMDLGGMGASVEGALKSGGSAINALIDGGMKTLKSGLKGTASGDVAKVSAVKLVSALPDEVQGAFRSATGVTSNPNTRVLFKSVNLREFAFTFKFIATSAKEAEEVKEIIKLFRTELYPENITIPITGANDISIGYRFPNKFQINVEYNGEEIATKIKPCYLRDVSVTYNNTAMAMHSDGNFQEVEMSLSFQESRTLNRKDVEKDGF